MAIDQDLLDVAARRKTATAPTPVAPAATAPTAMAPVAAGIGSDSLSVAKPKAQPGIGQDFLNVAKPKVAPVQPQQQPQPDAKRPMVQASDLKDIPVEAARGVVGGLTAAFATLVPGAPATAYDIEIARQKMIRERYDNEQGMIDNEIAQIEANLARGRGGAKVPGQGVLGPLKTVGRFLAGTSMVDLAREQEARDAASLPSQADIDRVATLKARRAEIPALRQQVDSRIADLDTELTYWADIRKNMMGDAGQWLTPPGKSVAAQKANVIGQAFASYALSLTATVATGNPALGAALQTAQQGLSTYANTRDEGRSVGDAAFMAGLDAAVAYKLEKLPLEILLKKLGSAPAIIRGTLNVAMEGAQEGVQQAASNVIQGNDILEGMVDAVIGGAGAGAIGGVLTAIAGEKPAQPPSKTADAATQAVLEGRF